MKKTRLPKIFAIMLILNMLREAWPQKKEKETEIQSNVYLI